MTGHLRVDKSEWNKIKRRLANFGRYNAVDVGFFSDATYDSDNGNLQVAQVAAWNDLGSRTNPPRPFLTVDYGRFVSRKAPEYIKQVFMMALISEPSTVNNFIRRIGNGFSEELKNIIWNYPGSNSPETVKKKGFNDPLIETGTMHNSVDFRIKKVR